MFDVGFWELALIGVVALLIVGPERLPGVVRTVGHWLGKARRVLRDAKADLEREMKAHDIEALRDFKSDVQNAGREFKRAASDATSNLNAAAAKPGDALRETIKDAAAKMDGDAVDGDAANAGDGDSNTADESPTATADASTVDGASTAADTVDPAADSTAADIAATADSPAAKTA